MSNLDTTHMTTVSVRTTRGTVEVTPGILNNASRQMLAAGYCASLAYLISKRTGWTIVMDTGYPAFRNDAELAEAISERRSFRFKHVLAQRPDSILVDGDDEISRDDYILSRLQDEVVSCAALYEITPEHCKIIAEEYCVNPDWELVGTFVEPILSRVARPPYRGLSSPKTLCYSRDIKPRGTAQGTKARRSQMSQVENKYFVKTRISKNGKFVIKGALRCRLPLGLSTKVKERTHRTYGPRWEAEHIATTMEELLWEDALSDLISRERKARKKSAR